MKMNKIQKKSYIGIKRRSFDAWGRPRHPDNWSYSNIPDWTHLDRGFTGHEHLPEFGLINMNGRMYDPIIGRFLSPDPYIQGGGTQSFNRYTYALNNPLKYTDPTGEFLSSIITGVVGFATAAVRTVAAYFVSFVNQPTADKMFTNAWKEYGNQMNYAWKIDMGLFKSDQNKSDGGRTWEIASRFTWQLPQTIVGQLVMTGGTVTNQVQNVTYNYGMTAVDWGGKNAVTIGNYTAGPRGYKADWKDHLFVHEYGHYIQSQQHGPVYLITVGIPSLQSAILQKNNPDSPRHDDRWFEGDASYKAAKYFDKHYGSEKEGYVAGSADYFDRNSFVTGSLSPYLNPRRGERNSSVNPTSGKFHWTDIPIYIPILGLFPYFFY